MSPKHGLLPEGRGSGPGDASLVRERAGTFSKFHCLDHSLREQVRSHALRPESRTDLCITLNTTHNFAFDSGRRPWEWTCPRKSRCST
ncbi:hypothetical protein E2N90_05560 [Pseudomonas syringae pv. tomato]|nr:hypothetical protein [Pseudomonas syringae pv. tomato]QBI63839.1 hypothetical protein EIZ61_21520 [Pseudomonas syringae]TES61687.1 hypothetical protein E2N91_00120 [Pseudomonas syringae pv. tomato]TES69360.1 hypothetical protein E2N90_05560 [Pseudomonas syringae pv. tomato]TES79403.1 hypothetical protein E2N89_08285 [Pseudomonas syringae pv. tomato]